MDKMDRQERLERTASMAYNKGLINNPGENNCFLNSAVQVLWHLDVFRRSFREIKGHYCMGQSCIFCALDFIFKQFQYSSNDALPPDGLRVALAVAFKNQHRFQLGDMDDAAECFENILSHMHTLVARNEHDDACTAKHCISHQKFAMQIIEQTICQCGEQSEPLPFFQLVHYVSASALCTKARSLKGWDNTRPIEKQFGVLLRRAGQDTRECQSPDCRDRVQVQRLLLNCPDIVSVGLIWDSESPDAEHIADVLQCIGTTLKLSDLYHQVYDERAKEASLQLVGIVTYYGKHYSTFFFHSKLRTWIYFDDARVKEIGPDWSVMMEKCRLCHYQPLLLLYANPGGTPISAESAPKEAILINGMVRKKDAHHSSKRVMSDSREAGDGVSDGEKSPVGSKKGRLRSKGKDEKRSLKSKKSLSSSDLTEPSKYLFRTPSNASDSGATSPRKEKHRPSFKRIGNAIMNVVNPALAVSHLKQGKKKNSHKASRRSSTGSGSESSGENDLIDLSSKNEAAKMEILKLYEQSKALNAAQVGAVNHDSGISSAPSSAGESVSSTDTNHGGSDEDLIDFNQSWRNSRYDNWPPVHQNDRIEIFLQQAGNYLAESESFETHKDFVGALSYCSEAASLYRRVVEEPGVDMKTKHFASTRRNACMARARNLRLFVQSPHDNRNTSVSLSKQREEELLHQQRQRDHIIMRQQQQFQQQVPPPQYTSLQRRDRFVSDKPVPQVGLQRVVEVPVYSSSQNGGQDRNYADEQYVASTYPLKVKAKPIVYSSGHYVSKAQQDKLGSGRVASGVCSQQIKPDSMCYNPVHYDRESEIAARIQNININSPRPKTNEEYTTVISVGDNRPKISENRHSRPSPVEQRRESSAVYISPSNSSNSRTVPTASFNPTVYRSNGTQSPPTITAVRPRPKVFYAGNSALGTNSSTRDRSPSPARSVDELDYIHSNRGAYGPRPRDYVPAPPYNSIHQREQLKSYSTSSLSKPRWYHNSPEDSVANNSRDFRPVSARVITDRPVCEKCRCIPIDRRQRLCAGCQQEVRQMHSNTARFY